MVLKISINNGFSSISHSNMTSQMSGSYILYVSHSVVSNSLQSHGGISQVRILVWVAISFSRGSSWPRDRTQVSCITGRSFTTDRPPGKPILDTGWLQTYPLRYISSPKAHVAPSKVVSSLKHSPLQLYRSSVLPSNKRKAKLLNKGSCGHVYSLYMRGALESYGSSGSVNNERQEKYMRSEGWKVFPRSYFPASRMNLKSSLD